MLHAKPDPQHITKGKLTVLTLALSSVLASMAAAPATVQAQVISNSTSTQQVWSSGDLVVNSGVLVSVNSLDAVAASGTPGTLTNNGSISSNNQLTTNGLGNAGSITQISNSGSIYGGTGISNIDGNNATIGALLNNNGGSIGGSNNGVYNGVNNLINTLSNAGTISAAEFAIYNNTNATIGTLNNSGLIHSTNNGIYNAGGTIGTLENSGIISTSATGAAAVFNSGFITIVNNTIGGTISGNYTGISNQSGTISTLTNSGLIESNNYAIYNVGGAYALGTITTLNNSGTISGAVTGIFNGSTISALTNTGTISGGAIGIYDNHTISTLTNSGLISGSTYAIFVGSGDTLSDFSNTGTIAGNIKSQSTSALSIAGGSGTLFGTLTGAGGALSTSDIGLITSGHGLILSGNQILNDNIDLRTSTSSTIANTITNTGTLQVNNPLTITGSYVQGSGATLLINAASPSFSGNITDSGYGRLVVSKNVTLDGSSVTIESTTNALAQGQRYVVVAAKGTLSANGVTYSAAGYTATAATQTDSNNSLYTDLVVTLNGSSGAGVINNASNSNSATSLDGLFNYTGTNANMLALFNAAAALDTADANKAGAQLNPAAVSSAVSQAAGAASQAVGNVATSHMDGFRVAQAGGSGVATGERATDIALWGQIFGGRAAQGERDSVSGYHAHYSGLVLGADTAVSDTLRAGGLFSASKTATASDGDNTGSSASINNYGLTAYGTYSADPWYLNAMASVARQQYSTVRAVSFTGFSGIANGSFNGQQLSTSVQAGYPLNLDAWLPGATLTPLAGLSYSSLRTNGYSETGGSTAALTINAATYDSLKSELGAKLEQSFTTSYGKLLPSVQLGWKHEFKDNAVQTGADYVGDTTGSTAFVSRSATAVANTGVLNLGVTLQQSERLSLTAKYTLEVGGGYTGQTGSVQVRYQY